MNKSSSINKLTNGGMTETTTLEGYFSSFRSMVIGHRKTFTSPFGINEILYADWTASGRAYRPIEEYLQNEVMPFLGNTHTETTITGKIMSEAYEEARMIVKEHVHAGNDDILIFCGSGMTGAINKLQRILGMRVPERLKEYLRKEQNAEPEESMNTKINRNKFTSDFLQVDEALRPVVFVTHMEHHSNQVSWLETIATVEIIQPDENGNVDIVHLTTLLEQYKHRKNKIAAITACSNVTGIQTPYHAIATLIHSYGGVCFVDFACAAPYIDINMHPEEENAALDAIYFSPHKFLGGPGTPGILVFNKSLYKNSIPDQPGGGTLLYSNPWREHEYIDNIEVREEGGTPPFLQGIKAAMCVRLKEEMGVAHMLNREEEILEIIFNRFSAMPHIEVLEGNHTKRLGVVSFIVKGAHHNLIVKILNDRFGVQTRGGCSCAGTYGHMLLQVDKKKSYEILAQLHAGNQLAKPGWVRLSIHPIMTNADIEYIMDSIELTATHFRQWMKDYSYDPVTNEYTFSGFDPKEESRVDHWFTVSNWK